MDDQPTTGSVQLTVDYSDGCRKYFGNLPWKSGMSVIDVLTAAKGGAIRLQREANRGRGSTYTDADRSG